MISAGYGRTPAEIGRYTRRQLHLFFREELAKELRDRRARLNDIHAAYVGGDMAKQRNRELETAL